MLSSLAQSTRHGRILSRLSSSLDKSHQIQTASQAKKLASSFSSLFRLSVLGTPLSQASRRHLYISPQLQSESLWSVGKRTSSEPEEASSKRIAKPRKQTSPAERQSRPVAKKVPLKRTPQPDQTENRQPKPTSEHAATKERPSRVKSTEKSSAPEITYADLKRLRNESELIVTTKKSTIPGLTESYVHAPNPYKRDYKQEREKKAIQKAKKRMLPTVAIQNINPKYDAKTLLPKVAVRPQIATDQEIVLRAQAIAQQLELPFFPTIGRVRNAETHYEFALIVGESMMSLSHLDNPDAPVVFADFVEGATAYRKSSGGADPKSPIMRAVRVNGKTTSETRLVDATGGLGVDAFMFATAGYNVTVLEKNVLVYTLLYDALERAKQAPHLAKIASRITLHHTDAMDWFAEKKNTEEAPDVIYLDPMYPIQSKMKAQTKKGMALARALVGKVDHANDLVDAALNCAKDKVILKRPYYTNDSSGMLTHFKSRSLRFEVFTRESWDQAGHPDMLRVSSPNLRREEDE